MAPLIPFLLLTFSGGGVTHADMDLADPVEVWVQRDLGQVMLLGLEQILIGKSVTIIGDVVVNEKSDDQEVASLIVGDQSRIGNGGSVLADWVQLDSGSRISGTVITNHLSGFGASEDLILDLALPVFPNLPPFAGSLQEETTGTPQAVTVFDGERKALEPGFWGAIVVADGATLVLKGGAYDCQSLTLGAGATLAFEAEAGLRLRGGLETGPDVNIKPLATQTAADLTIFLKGPDDGLFGPAVFLAERNTLAANIFAPNGSVFLGPNSILNGGVIARAIEIGDFCNLTPANAFGNRAPTTGDDLLRLGRGNRVTITEENNISLLANDFDPEGRMLELDPVPVKAPAFGRLALQKDGRFSYVHDGGASLEDRFTYNVCDTGFPRKCSLGTVHISILADAVTVTMNITGNGQGQVTLSPGGTTCRQQCTTVFSRYQRIELFASPDPGSVFTGWSGDEDCADGMLTGAATCTAHFERSAPEPQTRTLAISVLGGQGTVFTRPGSFFCSDRCQEQIGLGTPVTLYARPESGYRFVGWQGDCVGSEFSTLIEMNGDKQCQAVFRADTP